MYSSGYSQVSKANRQAQKKMQYRSKGKSCGYYMRIIFFFSSLIQSLIIVSLVLFLVYGKTQDSASTTRIQDLEESFSRLSIENVALRQQRRNLTTLLNVTLTEKTRNGWDLLRIRRLSNMSVMFIQDLDKRLQQTNIELMMCRNQERFPPNCPQPLLRTVSQIGGDNCGLQMERVTARLELVESNFTQTTQKMRMEIDQITKDRDNFNLEAIRLRRDKAVHLKEIEFCRQRCKEDFVQSLSGVSNVSRAFLLKIESLFPAHIAFQLTCEKQRDHLEQIRINCTSLSREVEDRFQSYLNNVGDHMSEIQSQNSRLKAENLRRSDDYRVCSQNRSGLIIEHRQTLEKLQLKHDNDYERLLLEKNRFSGDIEVLENSVKYKNKEVQHLTEQLRQLTISCMPKTGFGGLPGPGMGQFGRGGSDGFSSNFNSPALGSGKPGLTGLGSSTFGSTGLNPNLGSTGSGLNRFGSTGLGSSSVSSTGLGLNKQGSTGLGSSSVSSTGSGLNKLGSTGVGSSSLGSTGPGLNKLGSTRLGSSGLGSAGSGINKPGSTGLGSSGLGSAGSGINKLGSTGLGSSGLGSTGPGLNKPGSTGLGSSGLGTAGSGINKPGSTGLGSSGLGSAGSGINKLGSNGLGSSSLGSNRSGINKLGSNGLGSSSLGSTGTGLTKPGSTGLGSSSLGSTGSGLNKLGSSGLGTSSLGSTGSNNKPTSSLISSGLGSSGSLSSVFSRLGLASSNSNTGQSKPGSGTGRGTSSGSSLGTGRTGGLGVGSLPIAQHLEELQRIINPSYSYEERQELSRMLG